MPTYNRASRIGSAIRSVLAQSYRDFELVISNGGSTDETRDIVASFDDRRILYFETTEKLFIGDNYQRAYDQATGDYITFLSDDDSFLPSMLSEVEQIIAKDEVDVVVFRSCLFFDGGATKADGVLDILEFDRKVRVLDGESAAIAVLKHFGLLPGSPPVGFNVSYLANAIYKRPVFSLIQRTKPRLFEDTPADVYLALAVPLVIERYHCLDMPLHVWTEHGNNATADAQRKRGALKAHYDRLLGSRELANVPIKIPLPVNCTANALISALSDFGNGHIVQPDWASYYATIYRSIMELRSLDVDVREEFEEWESALACEENLVQRKVHSVINSPQDRLKRFILSLSPKIFRLLKRKAQMRSYRNYHYHGEADGLSDPYQCAIFAERLISSSRTNEG